MNRGLLGSNSGNCSTSMVRLPGHGGVTVDDPKEPLGPPCSSGRSSASLSPWPARTNTLPPSTGNGCEDHNGAVHVRCFGMTMVEPRPATKTGWWFLSSPKICCCAASATQQATCTAHVPDGPSCRCEGCSRCNFSELLYTAPWSSGRRPCAALLNHPPSQAAIQSLPVSVSSGADGYPSPNNPATSSESSNLDPAGLS